MSWETKGCSARGEKGRNHMPPLESDSGKHKKKANKRGFYPGCAKGENNKSIQWCQRYPETSAENGRAEGKSKQENKSARHRRFTVSETGIKMTWTVPPGN